MQAAKDSRRRVYLFTFVEAQNDSTGSRKLQTALQSRLVPDEKQSYFPIFIPAVILVAACLSFFMAGQPFSPSLLPYLLLLLINRKHLNKELQYTIGSAQL